jgi:hypothetical protein
MVVFSANLSSMNAQPQRIGTLDDDLTALAGAVHRELPGGDRMVWIDDQREVFIDNPGHLSEIPAHWLVGTFAQGSKMREIEDDLREMARERARNSMLG